MAVMPFAAFAHTNVTRQSVVNIASSPNLKGVVVDENKTPIDFVNVVLLKADSTYLAGTVTDKDGTFIFSGNWDSPKFVKISSIGYSSQTLDIPQTGDLGIIVLDIESTMLGEVVVKSNRPVTAIKGDALVTEQPRMFWFKYLWLSDATGHLRFSARAPRQSISMVVSCVIPTNSCR